MEIYVNKQPIGGIYLVYFLPLVFLALGWFSIFDMYGFGHNGLTGGAILIFCGVSFFLFMEWVFRRYIYRIEILENNFRITTRSIFGFHIQEGSLRYCGKLEKFSETIAKATLQSHSASEIGATYIMEPIGRRIILETKGDLQVRSKVDRAIIKFSAMRMKAST